MERTNDFKDLNDFLKFEELNQGILRIHNKIGDWELIEIQGRITYLKSLKTEQLTISINSPGGQIADSFAIYDYLKSCGLKTTAIVEGVAASAAAMIVLQAMDNRYSRPNSRFLLHEPRLFSFLEVQKTTDTQDRAKEMTILSEMVYDVLSSRCGKTKEELKKLIERREVWMSAKEALEFGLIDKII